MLASGLVATELDYDAIDAYLTFGYMPAPTTPLRRVRKLLPGHRLVVERGRVAIDALLALPGARPDRARRSERSTEKSCSSCSSERFDCG